MIVIDASAWVDISTLRASPSLGAAATMNGHWVVPDCFRAEALNGVRGLWLGRKISDGVFDELAREIATIDVDVWPTAPLVPRMRELAANANAYDASYLALAEELGCTLVTADAKLARVPGIRCRVVGFE